ncbi:hypothetical protein QT889_22455, partial [Xanthomonas citri pv. citri]
SIRSPARHEVFARSWPGALALVALALAVLLRGPAWARRLMDMPAPDWLRGRHGAQARDALMSILSHVLPVAGLWLLSRGLLASGLVGARAGTLVAALPVAGAAVVAAGWLAWQFLGPRAQPPFDLALT